MTPPPTQRAVSLSQADRYCWQLLAQSGSTFRISFYWLKREKRRGMSALYAFCRLIDDCVDSHLPPADAAAELARWREELQHLYHGSPRHPVMVALAPHVARLQLPQSHFEALIEGMEMDLIPQNYATFDELYRYCYRVAGVVGRLSATLLSPQRHDLGEYAEALGIALQLTNILRDLEEDRQRQRLYLPQQELQHYRLTPADLRLRHHPSVIELLQCQAERAQSYYRKAISALPLECRHEQLSALMMAALYHRLLQKMVRQRFAHPAPSLNKRERLAAIISVWRQQKSQSLF